MSSFFDEYDAESDYAPTPVKKKSVLKPSNAANKKAPAAKKKPASKKAAAKPKKKKVVSEEDSEAENACDVSFDDRAIEEIYQKKTQLEHILLRPDTYIGSTEFITQKMWTYDEGIGMNERDVTYVPGLYKIFDEILVNAADNKMRDPTMTEIRVTIDQENNTVKVWNNGRGIPVEIHAEEQIYVPEMIFGHLLTSSNYDDTKKKVVGGRNGYGAKLCNIFSKKFIVETADSKRKSRYKQVFTNNMQNKSEPEVTAMEGRSRDDFTSITFQPDLEKFGMTCLDKDTVSLMKKRVYDIAGTTAVKVTLNKEKLPVSDFKSYVELYLANKPELPRVYEKVNDRWEVCVSVSEGQFQHVSFVNSIWTMKGGQHVNHVADKIAKTLLDAANKKTKGTKLKLFQAKNHLYVFVRCLIENPAFDSQTKEFMTTKPASFGSSCDLSDKLLKKVLKCGVMDNILAWSKFKQNLDLKKLNVGKNTKRIMGIPKLEDANDAGTKNGKHCTLILTEGDSAKALAVAGFSVVGRDRYGVYPLRGKLLNVRDATHASIMNNKEIKEIHQILGLKFGTDYKTVDSLRYGRLCIMTDQDQDGSHIKGLIINLLHAYFPSLLKIPGFLCEFITPIVKVSKGKQSQTFFTIPEYENWKREMDGAPGWKIKYYKGLGTSDAQEAKEYFADLDTHLKDFEWQDDASGQLIDMAFNKKRADDRKEWLRGCEEGTYIDHNDDKISYANFINRELILFSMTDNVRSLPSMVDGLKPGQRKILFSCFKRNLRSEIKVAQLAGYVAEHSAYHHGEQSLMSTIINMAQNFVGANNINLLTPNGQFGTRGMGGKDAASPRYIFTHLHPITRFIFREEDDALLTYLDDDGTSIEPKWYLPILPMTLVNGAEGIGTGWSTSVPQYNPRDIVANLKKMIRGEEPEEMTPFVKNFQGQIIERAKGGYEVVGTITKLSDTTLSITELPVGSWTQSYKEFLEGLLHGAAAKDNDKGKKKKKDEEEKPGDKPFITGYTEHHTDVAVSFVVTLTEENMAEAERVGLHKKFKLLGSMATSNMHLFDSAGRITKYESPEEVMANFFELRRSYYHKRKEYMVDNLTEQFEKLDNKVRFILEVIEGKLVISKKKKAVLMKELADRGYKAFANKGKKKQAENEEEEEEEVDAANQKGYDYLLSMSLWSLTLERVEKLRKEREGKEDELHALLKKSPETLWEEDLNAFLQELDRCEELERSVAGKTIKAKGKRKTQKKKRGDDSDSDWEASTKKRTKKVKKKEEPEAGIVCPPAPEDAPAPAVYVPAPPKPSRGSKKKEGEQATEAKKAPKKAAAVKVNDGGDDDDDPFALPLAERLAMRAPLAKRKLAKKTPVVVLDDSASDCGVSDKENDDDFADALASKPKKAAKNAAPKKKAAAKKKRGSESETDVASPVKKPAKKKAAPAKKSKAAKDDSEEEEEEEVVKATKKPAPAKVKKTRAPAKKKVVKKKKEESEDDEPVEVGSDDDDSGSAVAVAPPPKRARRAAAAAVTYKEESEEESDLDESISEFDDDDDDSDY